MHIIDCAVQIKFCTVIDRCPHVIFSSAFISVWSHKDKYQINLLFPVYSHVNAVSHLHTRLAGRFSI